MICTEHDNPVKMNCTYSVPIGNKKVRYRAYKCPLCKAIVESVELTVKRFGELTEEKIKALESMISYEGRQRRFLGMRMRRTHK